MNMHTRQATLTWLLLISLTLISVLIGQLFNQAVIFTITIMLIVIIKGQQIIDVFMEMGNAPKGWRILMLSYAVIVPLIICIVSCLF
jgi:cytochrome c oxidase subunit IV